MGRDKNKDENESDTDDDISESDETLSTEKSSRNVDDSPESFYERLPMGCSKFSFLLLNSMILLAGAAVIALSIWILATEDLTFRFFGQRLSVTILLILGVFVFLVALTGIVGIVKRKEHLMVFYIICQTVALCAVFISLTISFPIFDMITKKVRDGMIYSMKNYQSKDWAEEWDNTHRYLKCCGIRSSRDWLDHHMNIPESCCSTSTKQCLPMTENMSYKSGCLKEAIILFKSYIQTTSISTLVICPILIISVLLAISLRKELKANYLTRNEIVDS
ncbi:hypothetical protein PUN28_004717 [Cardiocondyla obscurior]